jgi:serine/threonine protein kinase
VKVGSVLNHIYEVRTFLARGGMGEVFEGVNLTSHERVAIKVILPHLAEDAQVREMFLKEARVLTRLAHPAIRQYRLITQEPELGVLYMVNEFIDGPSLASVLGTLKPTEADIRLLLRRLADGLQVAHEMGAVHRDIAPDNVLLPDGRLDRAKIIDFGIVKDLDPSKKTIIGEGFAGKLGFVAPEQFGDFNREIGPWTDVYSLGLVILATALRHELDMGAPDKSTPALRRSTALGTNAESQPG